MPTSLKQIAVEVAARAVAAIGGTALFFLVFSWPTLTANNKQLMLAWGWVGWIPGGLLGYYFGRVLRRQTLRILSASESRATVDIPSHIRCMRIHRLIAIGCTLLSIILFFDLLNQGEAALQTVGLFALSSVAIAAVNGLIAFGAIHKAPWARVSSMLVGVILLICVPIGTLVGINLLSSSNWHNEKKLAKG
jgi:hypothetical protein